MADNYIDVTGQDFDEKILHAQEMVLVHFFSDQVSACKIQDPEIEAISKGFTGRVQFARLTVDTDSSLASQWNVDGLPTIIFFKGGKEINRIKGILMRDRLRRQIEGALLAS